MKLSTKGRYALRAMLDLSQHFGDEPIMLKDIARRQNISERYLEHLFLTLKKSGLVNSVRGARGGFMLAHPPTEINLSDIVRASEGDMSLVECVTDPESCPRSERCATRDIWVDVTEAMSGVLDSVTLQSLIEKQERKELSANNVYNI